MLKGIFQSQNVAGDITFMPCVVATVEYGNRSLGNIWGFMDTGACINLLSFPLAKPILGLERDDVLKGRKLLIGGVGDEQYAYGFKVNLKLRATTASTSSYLLRDSWLFVATRRLPAEILIGQRTGFENRAFFHLNKGQSSYWSLRDL